MGWFPALIHELLNLKRLAMDALAASWPDWRAALYIYLILLIML